jgi:hypothetical protein
MPGAMLLASLLLPEVPGGSSLRFDMSSLFPAVSFLPVSGSVKTARTCFRRRKHGTRYGHPRMVFADLISKVSPNLEFTSAARPARLLLERLRSVREVCVGSESDD